MLMTDSSVYSYSTNEGGRPYLIGIVESEQSGDSCILCAWS